MKDLAIYGAGGLGREFAAMVDQINVLRQTWRLIGFFDDNLNRGDQIDGLEVLGSLYELNHWQTPLAVVIGIANPSLRKNIVSGINNTAVSFPSLIHPHCIFDLSRNSIGRGSVITAGCIATVNVKVGNFVVVNLATTIGHDSSIRDFASIMPGCNISGNVKIGESCLLGTGAKILQNLSIGPGTVVGAGSVVTKNFADNVTIVGVPARIVQ